MSIIWLIWIVGVIGSFALFETLALMRGTPTLSRSVWTLSKAFPPFPAIFGLVVGFLACHFFWGGIICFAGVK